MLQIQTTHVHGTAHHYLVQTIRFGERTRQRILVHMGQHKTVEAALEYWHQREKVAKTEASRDYAREMVTKLAKYLPHS